MSPIDVIDRGVSRHAEVLLSLPDHLVENGGRDPDVAEATDGEVVAVIYERLHGLLGGHNLVYEAPVLAPEKGPGLVGVGVYEQFFLALRKADQIIVQSILTSLSCSAGGAPGRARCRVMAS
jgi:hypothetical protein